MNLTIYVHDFHPQIGHSRAMQELLNGLSLDQKTSIKSIEVVAFTCSDLNSMFAQFNCPKRFTKIPFPNIKPFLLKMFIYHLGSLFHTLTTGSSKKKIGIGVACLNVNIVNIQFIHEQWKNHFFQKRSLSFFSTIYKKILFVYFACAEKYIYSFRKNIRYLVIANFLKTFLQQKFGTNSKSITLIPSGVNVEEFNLLDITSEDIFKKLSINYPQISIIDMNQPIALFVGAFERKGLGRALEALNKIPNAQLIVIGNSENPNFVMPIFSYKIVHITFTKEVNLFYQLADIFIFPTYYEPFGLVIMEAYAMGLDLLVPIENVGASEIIPQSDGIHFFHQDDEITVPNFKKLSVADKQKRRTERLMNIKEHSWEKNGDKFYSMLVNS